MGLQERRKIRDLQVTILPERSREIAKICGQSIPYEVDWASLENDVDALNYLDNLSCHRVSMALRAICMGDRGREAVRGNLKLVRLRNVPDASQLHIHFSNGVLEMHCAYAQRMSGMHSDDTIRAVLLAAM
jgi:hypothetical protein